MREPLKPIVRDGQAEQVDLPIIRQSFCCFWLGALGLIPGIGVALAWQALSSFKSLCEATGEKPRVAFPLILFLSALALNPLFHVGLAGFGDVVATLLLVAIFSLWSSVQYFHSTGVRWNPARNRAWAGATFGAIGIAVSILALEFVYISAYGRLLCGLP